MNKKAEESREQELLGIIKKLKDENSLLVTRLDSYEKDGVDKLLNSLQRKANEMAELLNKHKLTDIDLDDKNSKTFERIRVVWTDAKVISESIQSLRGTSTPKVIQAPIQEEPKQALTAEKIADLYGNKAGQK